MKSCGRSRRVIRRASQDLSARLRASLALLGPVKDVNLQPALLAEEGGEQTDRPGTRHQHGPWLPVGTLADRGNLFPRLRDDRRGLESTPSNPSELSTFTAYSGSMRQRPDMNP